MFVTYLQGVAEALKRRAARHGRTAEAEHRLILADAALDTRLIIDDRRFFAIGNAVGFGARRRLLGDERRKLLRRLYVAADLWRLLRAEEQNPFAPFKPVDGRGW